MNPSNLIITIPEPCHEDWNAMTPDKTGKFCGSCCKSVIDFSNKTDTEIKNILMEYKDQKVCGHFKKEQINRPLNIHINFNDLTKNMSTTKSFAIALFFVFGTMLFSCTDFKGKNINNIEFVKTNTDGEFLRGDVLAIPKKKISDDSTKKETLKSKIKQVCTSENFVNGGISVRQVEPIQDTPKVITPQIIPQMMMGAVAYVVEEKDTLVTVDSTQSKINNHVKLDNFTDEKNGVLIFPNPTNGEFTVNYSVLKRADVRIEIFDEKGTLLKTLVNINNQHEGHYKIPVNITEYPNGVFILNVFDNNQLKSTKKIIKN